MKQAILLLILIPICIFAFCQNSVNTNDTKAIIFGKERWALDKYLWSQTHYKTGKGDKPVLDFEAIENWRSLGNDRDLSISPDGKYFAYSEKKSHEDEEPDSLVIQSIQNDWRLPFAAPQAGFFSADSRQYIFQSKEDLNFLETGGRISGTVKGVNSYKLSMNQEWLAYLLKDAEATVVLKNLLTGIEKYFNSVAIYGFDETGSWLTCKLKNESKDLLLYNLSTGKEYRFTAVVDYKLDEAGNALVIKSIDNETKTLRYVNLVNGEEKTIWSSADTTINMTNYSLDGSGNQVVFMLSDNERHNSIWYYRIGMDKAIMKVNDRTGGIDSNLCIRGMPPHVASFSDNGHYIMFFIMQQPDNRKLDADAVDVDVWSYKDSLLRTTQSARQEPTVYWAVIPTDGANVIRLTKEYELGKACKGDFMVVGKHSELINGDRYWTKGNDYDSNWLVSLKDGSRKLLPTRNGHGTLLWFSPRGNYLVYFDAERGYNFFSYNLNTGKIINISLGIPTNQLGVKNYYQRLKWQKIFQMPYGIAAWLESDQGILIYDDYDIWQLDLSGKKSPLNITNGYGRRHKTLLEVENGTNRGNIIGSSVVLHENDSVLLKAFNRENKYNGFCRKTLGRPGDPELLYMGPYFFQGQAVLSIDQLTNEGIILKANGSNTWIVKRQSATDAPNYFVTHDFRTYTWLTDIQPQKNYNWLTSELHRFRQIDGTISQGVLYKPENFDPQKKYPVIISFYFHHSDQLNVYPSAKLLNSPTDFQKPAWFVSHGYLIFCPDIYFRDKDWGPSVMNTMDGAIRYLKGLTYVDGKRIGLSGHSNSGRMGYYVLTHSHAFAAMSIGTGAFGPDFLSSALSFEDNASQGRSSLRATEIGATHGLGNLWENRAKWLDHTAVLQADKITSPLLLFFNDKDVDPVRRGAELFSALWRLEKKVWWLDYNNGRHTLYNEPEQKDYTIRYTQFFDHYLKGAPPPRWMTDGIPYKLKRIENRYELNPSGSCGKGCPVCNANR
jgi:dipeptidyl aminopeptidase/acylaminoacyl peptidase